MDTHVRQFSLDLKIEFTELPNMPLLRVGCCPITNVDKSHKKMKVEKTVNGMLLSGVLSNPGSDIFTT